MNALFDKEWRGLIALAWLTLGACVEFLIEHFVDPLVREYFSIVWIFVGWLGPAFLLAVTGIRGGNLASRICAIIVLIAFALPPIFILWASIELRNR